ncbi:MAG: DUF805 domain-containing protein [Tsuneonella sp.]
MQTQTETWRDLMVRPLRRYADFRGRSGRREFWWYCLFLALGYGAISIVVLVAAAAQFPEGIIGGTAVLGYSLFFLFNLIPGLALTTRRLHDLGLSGVLLLVIFGVMLFFNVIGWIGYLIVMSLPGQVTANRWGPPLGVQDVADVFG